MNSRLVTLPPTRPRRKILGMSAILLPLLSADRSSGAFEIDWNGFEGHVCRTFDAGLVPAINMDTGYGNFIDSQTKEDTLRRTQAIGNGQPFLAGAFVGDRQGDAFALDRYKAEIDQIKSFGGTPIIFQSFGLTQQSGPCIVDSYQAIGDYAGEFYAFELGNMFAPFGAIYDIEVFCGLLQVKQCLGSKHSSLSRQLEWERLAIRDQVRPDFKLLTGNDLAIDMVMYGSDYLLGLSTFAPAEFARRDAMWAAGDSRFYELNDVLQYLGCFAFRAPVPAYKHSAAQFLHFRGWLATSLTHPRSPERPGSDVAILENILEQLEQAAS